LAIGGGAAAITDTKFIYTVPQVKYYSIDPADLDQDDPGLGQYARHTDRLNNEGNHQCFSTGVHLPTPAKGSSVWVKLFKGFGNTPVAYMYRVTLALSETSEMARVDFPGPANVLSLEDNTIVGETYSSKLNSYSFRVCLGPFDEFYGARITYSHAT